MTCQKRQATHSSTHDSAVVAACGPCRVQPSAYAQRCAVQLHWKKKCKAEAGKAACKLRHCQPTRQQRCSVRSGTRGRRQLGGGTSKLGGGVVQQLLGRLDRLGFGQRRLGPAVVGQVQGDHEQAQPNGGRLDHPQSRHLRGMPGMCGSSHSTVQHCHSVLAARWIDRTRPPAGQAAAQLQKGGGNCTEAVCAGVAAGHLVEGDGGGGGRLGAHGRISGRELGCLHHGQRGRRLNAHGNAREEATLAPAALGKGGGNGQQKYPTARSSRPAPPAAPRAPPNR